MYKILEREEADKANENDKKAKIKNSFRWAWMEKSVSLTIGSQNVTTSLADHIRKIDIPGKVLCKLCAEVISYANRGCSTIERHITTAKHKEKLKVSLTNYQLPSALSTPSTEPTQQPYGLHPMFKNAKPINKPLTPIVPIADRAENSKATVLSTLAENDLSLSAAPVVIGLAKELSKDRKVLETLTMDRTTASYKLIYGLGKTLQDEMLEEIRSQRFSLNIDESTSNSNKRVLAILVSYFSPSAQRIVLKHLTSLELVKVDTESIFKRLVDLFEELDIPWANLVSILMDSCSVMRGSKNGLEKRIREEKAPQMLDIDGDICHHVHNATKMFCEPFGKWVEGLYRDLHTDSKWCAKVRKALEKVCSLLSIKFTLPENYANHRWLSVYDLSVSTLRMMDALQVFYYSFLPRDLKEMYKKLILDIFRKRNVSFANREELKQIQNEVAKMKGTADGQKRRTRIADKILTKRTKTLLTMNFYNAVLPIMKQYVMLFQSKEPLIHQVYQNLEELFRNFLSCYVKPECIPRESKSLKSFDLQDPDILLPRKDLFLGNRAKEIILDADRKDHIVIEFIKTAKHAYLKCGAYLQKKLPLNNKVLRYMSCLDPEMRGNSITLRFFQNLEDIFPILDTEEKERYALQIRYLQTDINVPKYTKNEDQVDLWWVRVASTSDKYAEVCRFVLALLSIFHGPQVESSFNTMGDIIDKRSCRMKIETYSAYQTVKYHLRAHNKKAVELFRRNDILHDVIDPKLCRNMKNASAEYRKALKKQREVKGSHQKLHELKRGMQTKTDWKKQLASTAKRALNRHQSNMRAKHQLAKKPSRLTNMEADHSTRVPFCQKKKKEKLNILHDLAEKKQKSNRDH